MKGRIGFFYPKSNIDSIPSIHNAAYLLAKEGYQIEIFTSHKKSFVAPNFDDKNIKIYSNIYYKRKNILINYRLKLIFSILINYIKRNYICLFGIDQEGLIEAFYVSKFIKVPIIYFSLEILFLDELKRKKDILIKQREIEISKKLSHIIIQDPDRGRLLSSENGISMDKFIYVPNSPCGPSRIKKGNYWHKKFKLNSSIKIVLHTGSIKKWTALDQIVNSVKAWPENWVLVIHSRQKMNNSKLLTTLTKNKTEGRVLYSLYPVSHNDYDELIDGADIGIAFYTSVPNKIYAQKNMVNIGLSSGKISYYLRSGLPVIVNKDCSISTFIREQNCGQSVSGEEEIGKSISIIEKKYNYYSENARKSFNQYLDFESNFNEVIKRIDELN